MRRQIFTLGLTIALCFLMSCKSENIANKDIEESTLQSELIADLSNFNVELLATSNPETRGLRDKFLKLCSVAGADILGTWQGIKTGASIGGSVGGLYGAAIGGSVAGLVCGAGASYVAEKAVSSEQISNESPETLFASDTAYADPLVFYRASIAASENLPTATATRSSSGDGVCLPPGYEHVEEIGVMHNEVLALVLNGETFDHIEITEPVVFEFATAEFIDEYQAMANNIFSSVRELQEVDIQSFFENMDSTLYTPITQSVLTLFYDIYTQYPEKIEDVDFIVNYYINAIYESGEISDSDKEALLGAMAVAAYSPRFWMEYHNSK